MTLLINTEFRYLYMGIAVDHVYRGYILGSVDITRGTCWSQMYTFYMGWVASLSELDLPEGYYNMSVTLV